MSFLGNHAVASACLARPGGDFNTVWGLIQSWKMIQHLPVNIESLYCTTGHDKSNKLSRVLSGTKCAGC